MNYEHSIVGHRENKIFIEARAADGRKLKVERESVKAYLRAPDRDDDVQEAGSNTVNDACAKHPKSCQSNISFA